MKHFFTLGICTIFQLFCIAQNKNIQLINGKCDLYPITSIDSNFLLSTFDATTNQYYLIASINEVNDKSFFLQHQIELVDKLSNTTYLIKAKKGFAIPNNITHIGKLQSSIKINKNLTNFIPTKSTEIVVSYYGLDKKTIIQILHQKGIQVKQNSFEHKNAIYVNYNKTTIDALAALPFVTNIAVADFTAKPLNDDSKEAHGVSAVNNENNKNLTGKNIVIGHGDLGKPEDHIDLITNSINNYNSNIGFFHGNHTHGIASGLGLIDEKYKGVAAKATTINNFYQSVLINTPSYVQDFNMVATNNSYYLGANDCPGNGIYNELSNYIDNQANSYTNNLHVFAAGNDGFLLCTPYPTSYGTIKSGLQTSKNAITVGSLNTTTYMNAGLSSRGPTYDGRIKPEIIAKGENVTSTVPVNIYDFTTGGTSMAAPVVTGAVALVQQRNQQLNGTYAKSDLVKALLCNSSTDLGNYGPDYTYGFGMLNVRKSINALENNQYFNGTITTTGNTVLHTINVPANTRRLKAMLCYIDREGTVGAPISLINDLNITVKEPIGTIHRPYILNATPSNVTDVATEGRDSTNNIEQCIIENPTAGSYEVSVNGYNLFYPNQNYVVVYEIESNGITIDFPNGGEKLIPGETERIRWTAFGEEANNYAIEYSENNGGSWTTINNNVNAAEKSLSWTVPTTATIQCLIRMSRNGGAITTTSNAFTILNAPTVTLANACIGAVAVSWTSITSATSYDVMIKNADSMKVIANTTALDYIINNLNPNERYWITVRANIGLKSGKRGEAKSIIPNTGTCTVATFDNDLRLSSINTPNTGRIFTNSSSRYFTSINFNIQNLDNAVSNSNIDVSYSINGGAAVTETIAPTIAAGGSVSHSFAYHNPGAGAAVLNIKVWLTKASDLNKGNDTLTKTVKLLANDALTLPFNDGFETATNNSYLFNTLGLDGLDRYDFSTPYQTVARARTYAGYGFPRNGNRAITLDQLPITVVYNDTLKGTFNLSNYDTTNNQLRLEFYYRDQGQEKNANNKVWIKGTENNSWLQAYTLDSVIGAIGVYKKAAINLNDVFSNAAIKQQFSNSFQIAIGQAGQYMSTLATPVNLDEDGYTIDDLSIVEAINDIGLQKINSPALNECATSSTHGISIKVKNYGNATANNITVNYQINGGAIITETIPTIGAKQELDYTFITIANLGSYIDYNINVWLNYPTDNYTTNDSILNYAFHNSPLISSFPNIEGFETDNGNWYIRGSNSSWAWGTPTKTLQNRAANGTKVWSTSLNTAYNDNELSYLISPCYNLSSLTSPTLSFSFFTRIEDDCPCDYAWMEYSTNGGLTWQKLGAVGQGTNWYDNAAVQAWQLSKTRWHVATIPLPTNSTNAKFRFVMQSDGGVTLEGLAFDDVHVYEGANIYTGANVTSGISQNVSGSNWINFTSGGNIIAAIQPQGNNLGSTETKVFINTTGVRNSNNQYYVDRNIVLQPTTPPSTATKVRFYFTEQEVLDVLNANTCGLCTKPLDAYQFGITKFSGALSLENGTLDDNTNNHTFILPVDVAIIPYKSGYYAEFEVNSFSEFWLNHGGLSFSDPLPIETIQLKAQLNNKLNANLQWKYIGQEPIAYYTIEKSLDGIAFLPILNNTNLFNYIDVLYNEAAVYYRIKATTVNGNIIYSNIEKLIKGNIKIGPNPTKHFVNVQAYEMITKIVLYNAEAKNVLNKNVNNNNNASIDVSKLPNGIYHLQIHTLNNTYNEKIIVLK